MTTYAIGDVHGQFDALMSLLDKINYDEQKDTLWFVGDYVNRGPKSIEVLRWLIGQKNIIKILGNHDISLIYQYFNYDKNKASKTVNQLKEAEDGDYIVEQMLDWPLLHKDELRKTVMVHAGIYPNIPFSEIEKWHQKICSDLQSKNKAIISNLFHNGTGCFNESEAELFILNSLCRMRYVNKKGCLDFDEKGWIKKNNKLMPWFELPMLDSYKIIFGHWAALGYKKKENWVCIDSGAGWNIKLTAFDVDNWKIAATKKI